MSDENAWRMTSMPVKFIFVDARAALLIPPFLLHVRPWTAALLVACLLVFAALERRGYTVPVALRVLRGWIYSGGSGRFVIRSPSPSFQWYDRK